MINPPPGRGRRLVFLVVCLPLLNLLLVSPVSRILTFCKRFIMLDFPTPLGPPKAVILFWIKTFSWSTPIFSFSEIRK